MNGRLQPRSVVGRQLLGRPAARMTLIFGVAVTDDVVLSIVLIVAGIVLTLHARP